MNMWNGDLAAKLPVGVFHCSEFAVLDGPLFGTTHVYVAIAAEPCLGYVI